MSISAIWRDALVRYQQTAIRQTGRRPITFLRAPMDEKLLLPGCSRPGYAFWQPIAWEGPVPLGKCAHLFHQSIIDYVSLCQFLEVRFVLPVSSAGSQLGFLRGRVFETCRNTALAPPSRAFEEAAALKQEPLCYVMAQTCDGGAPLAVWLRAEDGQVLVGQAGGERRFELRLGLDRLLPKLPFAYL